MKKRARIAGFTIVELLIVVVVIAILAAITIVAFNGVTRSAIDSSMKADLRNAIVAIDTDKTITGEYPASLGSANGGKGVKASGDNTLTYSAGRNGSFCLMVENSKNNTKYHSSSTGREIAQGGCGVFVGTLAGTYNPFEMNQSRYVNGALSEARFSTTMRGIDIDSTGNIFIADTQNMAIRKITPSGTVSTLAGRLPGDSQPGVPALVDGDSSTARFYDLHALTVAPDDSIYVSDRCTIRKVTQNGTVSTVAGSMTCGLVNGATTAAQFRYIYGLAVDAAGNIFAADRGNHVIRKVTPGGQVMTLAGTGAYGYVNGAGSVAQFHNIGGMVIGSDGTLYVADEVNSRIRAVTQAGVVSTFAGGMSPAPPFGQAGDGTGVSAFTRNPTAIAIDSDDNIFVATHSNVSYTGSKSVRKITPEGIVTTLAGDGPIDGVPSAVDGPGPASRFGTWVYGLAADTYGAIYLTDQQYSTIRKITQ